MNGAGNADVWRRSHHFLEQVRFLGGDLRREMGFCALHWRKSPPFFHTCASNTPHLRRQHPPPAPFFSVQFAMSITPAKIREGWENCLLCLQLINNQLFAMQVILPGQSAGNRSFFLILAVGWPTVAARLKHNDHEKVFGSAGGRGWEVPFLHG